MQLRWVVSLNANKTSGACMSDFRHAAVVQVALVSWRQWVSTRMFFHFWTIITLDCIHLKYTCHLIRIFVPVNWLVSELCYHSWELGRNNKYTIRIKYTFLHNFCLIENSRDHGKTLIWQWFWIINVQII